MDTDAIIDKVKGITDLGDFMSDRLAVYLRNADERIHSVFFGGYAKTSLPDSISAYADDIRQLARIYTSRVIAETTDFQVNQMVVSGERIEPDLSVWFSERNQTVGEALALEKLQAVLPEIFQNPQEYGKKLAETLSSQSFINGMAVYCDINPQHQQPLRLLWLLLKRIDLALCNEVMGAWNKTEYSAIVGNFPCFPWLDAVKANLSVGTKAFYGLLSDVKNACNVEAEVSREEKSDVVDITSSGAPIIQRYTLVTYEKGVAVRKWIRDDSRYASGGNANFTSRTEKVLGGGGGGCVLSGTKILAEHGQYGAMEDLQAGDRVMSEQCLPSVFSGELVHNDHVGLLYSINDDEPFMSLDHMILTKQGYKCLEPEEALRINGDVPVSLLKINDVVVKYFADEHNHITKKYEKVRKINIVENTMPCVDIHISNGYKSYVTESGYVCYANYPEITAKNIADNLSNTGNYFARRDFRRTFARNKEELKAAFGEPGVNYIEQLIKNKKAGGGDISLVSQKMPDYLLRSVDFVDMDVHGVGGEIDFSKLHIVRGHLFFDEDTDNCTRLSVRDGNYYWRRLHVSGREEYGMLRMYGNGFYGEGIVRRGDTPTKFSVSNTNIYTMRLLLNDGREIDCGTYEMGYKKDGETFVPVGDWSMGYLSLTGDKKVAVAASTNPSDASISYYVDKEHRLGSHVNFSGLAQKQFDALNASGMQYSELTFNTYFDTVSGNAFKGDGKGGRIELGSITGNLDSSAADKIMMLSDRVADFQILNSMQPQEMAADDMDNVNAMLGKSVLDLYNLPQPENMGEVHSECFDKMIKMSAHAAYHSDDEVKKYIGISQPTVGDAGDLTPSQAKIAEDNKEFFVDGLALAYLSYSYSKSTEEKISKPITDIPGYENKIKYYMQGKDKGCMSTTSGYQTATNDLYKIVYAANVPGLADYVSDPDRKTWALKLYQYCSSPAVLNGLILTNLVDPDNTRINHLCTMLDVLDSSGQIQLSDDGKEKEKYSYGAALRKQVTDLTFKYAFKNVTLPDKDDKEGISVLAEMIAKFLETYFHNLNNQAFKNWSQEMYEEAFKDLEEAAKEAGYADTKAYIDHVSEIAADAAAALVSLDSPDMPVRIVEFFEKHPKVSKAFCMAFYVTGVMTLIMGFTNWSKLTEEEKAELIGGTVTIGIVALNDVLAWRACGVFKSTYGALVEADSAIVAACEESDFVKAFAGSGSMEEALTKLGTEMSQITTAEGDIMAAASRWTSVCKIASAAAKVASVLMMAAALGFQIYETVKDFESGQPPAIQAMDIIQDISCGVCFLVEAGSGVAALCGIEVCSAIPVVGVIFAVVGIIAAVVMLFLHRKQPPAPIEIFIRDRCVPFVKQAADPPQKWLDEQKKIDDHLGDGNCLDGWRPAIS